MVRNFDKLKAGAACFLVKDASLLRVSDGMRDSSIVVEFYDWLKANGYSPCGGWWIGVDWVYINLNAKVYCPGMPGISIISGVVGERCITAEEYKTIHEIYKKYEGKAILEF